MPSELTIVVPSYNEKANILPLLNALKSVLGKISWEVIIVDDDSPDGTATLAREIARNDSRVRCIQRFRRRGLSSACIEGILASSSPFVCVMDADLQHDEQLLPNMLNALMNEDLELVIGSRYLEEGSTGKLPQHRVWLSKFATNISKLFLKQSVTDPMSGYFMFRRGFFEQIVSQLSGKGFKILLDILVSTEKKIKLTEFPYSMRERSRGESKLNYLVVWEFILLLVEKLFRRLIPRRFISFVIIGFSGVFVHLLVLWIMHRYWVSEFLPSQTIATVVAMTSNFILNNHLTYYDKSLHGIHFCRGLFSFYLACSVGAIINVALATMLYESAFPWWVAGLFGAIAGAVWNFSATAVFTWGEKDS